MFKHIFTNVMNIINIIFVNYNCWVKIFLYNLYLWNVNTLKNIKGITTICNLKNNDISY